MSEVTPVKDSKIQVTSIENLTPKHAQLAIMRFYELLPEELWLGSKLSLESIEDWSDELQDEASSDIELFLTAMLEEADESLRGKAAQILLAKFNEYETFKPYIWKAIEDTTGKMASRSTLIGALLVVMVALPSKVEVNKGPVKINWDIKDPIELASAIGASELLTKVLEEKKNK